jgi:hypothetical protein
VDTAYGVVLGKGQVAPGGVPADDHGGSLFTLEVGASQRAGGHAQQNLSGFGQKNFRFFTEEQGAALFGRRGTLGIGNRIAGLGRLLGLGLGFYRGQRLCLAHRVRESRLRDRGRSLGWGRLYRRLDFVLHLGFHKFPGEAAALADLHVLQIVDAAFLAAPGLHIGIAGKLLGELFDLSFVIHAEQDAADDGKEKITDGPEQTGDAIEERAEEHIEKRAFADGAENGECLQDKQNIRRNFHGTDLSFSFGKCLI